MFFDSKETERYYNTVKAFYGTEINMALEAVLTKEDIDNFVEWCRILNPKKLYINF